MKDQLYKQKLTEVGNFCFNQEVSEVFEDMINRSVPDYQLFLNDSAEISQWHIDNFFKKKNLRNNPAKPYIIYDLGCSTLASSMVIATALKNEFFKITAVDNSQAMLKKAEEKLAQLQVSQRNSISIANQDVRAMQFDSHQLSVLNFILQFLTSVEKTNLLTDIYQSLDPDGVVIIGEKIDLKATKKNQKLNQLINFLHHQFKKTNGYSSLEIKQNLDALKNVLHLETPSEHLTRLKKIGFSQCGIVRQTLNFASIVAFKV